MLVLMIPATSAEEPSLVWDRTYSIGISSQAFDVVQTRDGGFAIAGTTVLSEVSKLDNYIGKNYDAFLIRTDPEGRELWNRTYGTMKVSDGARTILETRDGGFIIGGYGGAYLIRTDSTGNVIWEKHNGQYPEIPSLNGLCELTDGNFIIAGEIPGNSTLDRPQWSPDAYLAEIDRKGEIIWERSYPGGYTGGFPGGVRSLDCSDNGGYLLCIYGKLSLIRTDERGLLIWSADHDTPLSYARLSPDGGAVATGLTISPETGYPALFLMKTDSWGAREWEIQSPDVWGSGRAIEVTSDGEYLATGTAIILKGGMTAEKTIPFNSAITLLKTDDDGKILWNITLSPAPYCEGMMVRETSDKGYIVLGNTADEAGQESLFLMGYLSGEVYLAKLGGEETIAEDSVQSASTSPSIHKSTYDQGTGSEGIKIPHAIAFFAWVPFVLLLAGRRKSSKSQQ